MPAILGRIFLALIAASSLVLLISGLIMLISSISSNIYGAPYVPMARRFVKDLLSFAGVSDQDIFYDLGSGDGRILLSAASDFQVKRAFGYEATLWPYLESRFLLWQEKPAKDVKIYHKNFFKSDFSEATLIYIYLFPKLVDKLAFKISNDCKSGTKILCPSFPINTDRHPEFKLLKSEKIDKITAYLYQKV